MLHNGYLDNFAAVIGQLEHVQDGAPNFFGTIYGTYELPDFGSMPFYGREDSWWMEAERRHAVFKRRTARRARKRQHHRQLQAAELVAPPSVQHLLRELRDCGQPPQVNTKWILVNTYNTVTACDATSPTPAFHSALAYYLAEQQHRSQHSSAASPIGGYVALQAVRHS
jgi:hypothetical protein